MLNKMVKVTMRGTGTQTVFSGKVTDVSQSGKNIWVQTSDNNDLGVTDWVAVNLSNPNINTVEEIVEEKSILDQTCEVIEDWMYSQGLRFDGYGGNNLVEYMITGVTYNVYLGVEVDCDDINTILPFSLSTTHNDRYAIEDAKPSFDPYKDPSGKSNANETTRKTLKGLYSYISKYAIHC